MSRVLVVVALFTTASQAHAAPSPGKGNASPAALECAPGQPLPALPGEVALRTYVKQTFVTAVGGGGRTTDVVHTDAAAAQAWERFKLLVDPATGEYALQTSTGNYLTAVNGGGLTSDTIHSDASQVSGWERFRLWPQGGIGYLAVQTSGGNFVTAIGGGGKIDDTIHTDARQVGTWEWFQLQQCGDIGTGQSFALHVRGGAQFMWATNGGGQTSGAVVPGGFDDSARFVILAQADGSYALQTRDGHYLTAVGGGGQTSEVFHTDATQISTWEKFDIVHRGDCTYGIMTLSGKWLGTNADGSFRTDLPSVTDENAWVLVPFVR
jgi:hypothetical protein